MDLEELGRLLRGRREALDLTRDELARRVGVTPTYIFMIESARPRSGGSPSRPKRETLKRWLDALGLDRDEANRALDLAGYHPLDEDIERHLSALHAPAAFPRVMYDADETIGRDITPAFAAAPPPPPLAGASQPEPDVYHARYLLQRRLDRLLDTSRNPAALIKKLSSLLEDLEGER
ncbi:MAG TPA: helix-turn-helix transcriptional regulator [Chloroflexota bacterium]|nr:helix-turn-helix transcriptional regulator [Chloroflexota bacterium]